MNRILASLLVLALSGCSVFRPPEPERHKIIAVPVTKVKTKTVVKEVARKCPPVPPAPAADAPSREWFAIAITVIRMYKECIK